MLDRLKKSVCLTLAGAILAMQVVMPVGGWGNGRFDFLDTIAFVGNFDSSWDIKSGDSDSSSFQLVLSSQDFSTINGVSHYDSSYAGESLIISCAYADDDDDTWDFFVDILDNISSILSSADEIVSSFKKIASAVQEVIDLGSDLLAGVASTVTAVYLVAYPWTFTLYVAQSSGGYVSTTISGYGLYELILNVFDTINDNVVFICTQFRQLNGIWTQSVANHVDDVVNNLEYLYNLTEQLWTYNYAYDNIFMDLFYPALDDIQDRLYYNSGSVAYWCYQVYASLHSGTNTAFSRLTNIYTTLSNFYSAWSSSGGDYSDLVDAVNDIYDLLVIESDDIESIVFSLSSYMFSDSDSVMYVYPTSITETSSGSNVTVYYYFDSDYTDNVGYISMRFYSSSSSYTTKTVSSIKAGASGTVTYSFSFVPTKGTVWVYDDYYLNEGYNTWFSTTVTYQDMTTAELLYQILASLSGVSTGTVIVNASFDTTDLEEAINDLIDYLQYQDGSVAYWCYKIYQAQDVDSNSDLLSTLSSLASLLLESTEFVALFSELATVDVSDTVPVVVLTAAVTFSASLAAVDAVAPSLDVYIPLGDGSAYTSSFDFYDLSSYLEIWKAVVLVLYALGLVQAFRSYVLKPGGDD